MPSRRLPAALLILSATVTGSCHWGELRVPAGAAVARAEAAAQGPAARRSGLVRAIVAYVAARSSVLSRDEMRSMARALAEESRARGIEPRLVLAVMEVESRFDAFAVSSGGAMGLMQILPSTGKALAKQLGMPWHGPRTLFDPEANVRLGVAYLDQLRRRFGRLEAALAAYNWGPGTIGRRVRRGAPLPAGYTERVMQAYSEAALRPIQAS